MATIEEKPTQPVDAENSSSDDEAPGLEPATGAAGAEARKESRSEKKSRKAIMKLGLKAVPDITRVTVKRGKGVLFAVNKPDVYKSPVSETYIIFGEAKVDDFTQQAQAAAAESLKAPQVPPSAGVSAPTQAAAPAAPAAAAPAAVAPVEEADDGTNEEGLEPKDIELVMAQAGVSRQKAVAALRRNKKDIVNTIMDLNS